MEEMDAGVPCHKCKEYKGTYRFVCKDCCDSIDSLRTELERVKAENRQLQTDLTECESCQRVSVEMENEQLREASRFWKHIAKHKREIILYTDNPTICQLQCELENQVKTNHEQADIADGLREALVEAKAFIEYGYGSKPTQDILKRLNALTAGKGE